MTAALDPAAHRDAIGTTTEREIGEISRREARRYARAVEDDNPLFHDVDFARSQGYDDVVVPPNYLPAQIETGVGAPADTLREDGLDPSSYPIEVPPEAVLMGGGQELTFHRYVVAGEVIRAETTLTDLYQRESERMGVLTFIEQDVAYFSGDERVLTCHETVIVGDRQ